MLSFISLHKENWRSHSYAAARCVGGSGAVSNAESEFQYRHRLSLHGQRCRRSGGEQKNIRQTLYTGHKTRNPRSRIQRLERGLIM